MAKTIICCLPRKLLAVASLLCASQACGSAFGFGSDKVLSELFDGTSLKSESLVELSVLKAQRSKGMAFTDQADVADSMYALLHDKGLGSFVGLRKTRSSRSHENYGLTFQQGTASALTTSDYEFHVGGYPICGVSVRSIEHTDGSIAIVGDIPLVNQSPQFTDTDWPDQDSSAQFAIRSIAVRRSLHPEKGRVTSAAKCLMNEQGHLEPVWDFIVMIDGLQFGVQSTPWQIMAASPRYFDATATIRAYDPNVKTGVLKDYHVTTLGEGALENERFITRDFLNRPRAFSAVNSFIYEDKSDPHFAEASTFVYANQQYNFMSSLGYKWPGIRKIDIVTHARIENTVNNAFYLPFDGQTGPSIFVGDGDGVVLQNLAFDSDVVSHEFGHHIIYDSVYRIAIGSEAAVLHEGLADFLAFSRTGDPCLGESVCPEKSASCQVKARCLRTAENSLKYMDDEYINYGSSFHLRGQLVSGFLWDLRRNGIIAGDTLTRYVLEAISYLPSAANVKSLVAAILYVDQKHGSLYQSGIVETANNRSLGPSDLGIELASLPSSIDPKAAPPADSDEGHEKRGFLGCGTIGSDHARDQGAAKWLVILLFGLPMILRIMRSVARPSENLCPKPRIARSLILLIPLCVSASANGGSDTFKIEIVPTIVWQGQPIQSDEIDEVVAARSSYPKLKMVHAVNPRLLMRGKSEMTRTQSAFGAMLKEGDGIVLHVSRLREWLVYARLIPSTGENLFGIVSDSCDEQCGADQSLVGLSSNDLATMITTGLSEMNHAGFGSPKIVVFEQGLVPEAIWSTLRDQGVKSDWSGFNISLLRDRLKGFPLLAMNQDIQSKWQELKGKSTEVNGRSLDHARFGVWLEGVDLTQIAAQTDAAIQYAKLNGRTVILPLFVNAATLPHMSALLREGIATIYEKVGNAGGEVIAWSGDNNSDWDPRKLKFTGKPPEVAEPVVPKVEELPVKIVTEPSAPATVSVETIIEPETYEDAEIIPSHAREMSH